MRGKPFVTDTTTLTYHLYNSRFDEINIRKCAYRHGFNPNSLGAPFIVADGFIGHDDIRVDIPNGNILKETYIGRAWVLLTRLLTWPTPKATPLPHSAVASRTSESADSPSGVNM